MKWKSIRSAPKDGTKIDLWLNIHASPMSMGFSDSFRVIDCWFREGKWFHWQDMKGDMELRSEYITHWMPIAPPPKVKA